jgi:hypothetical protein
MSLKERILKIINEKEYCRNNDYSLCAEIWNQDCEIIGYNLSEMSAITFIHLSSTGQISKEQTILRTRRGLNNQMPETIGKSYKSNLRKQKKVVLKSKYRSQKENDAVIKRSNRIPSLHMADIMRKNISTIHQSQPYLRIFGGSPPD